MKPGQSTYPEPHRQYHSYGIRFWNSDVGQWWYLSTAFVEGTGHVDDWSPNEYSCRATTGLLSAMFDAQKWAHKLQVW